MPWYRFDDGTIAHLKFSKGKAPASCRAPYELDATKACGRIATLACDWPIGEGKTCDAPLCAKHGLEVGPDRHYCPKHAAMQQQASPALPLEQGR